MLADIAQHSKGFCISQSHGMFSGLWSPATDLQINYSIHPHVINVNDT